MIEMCANVSAEGRWMTPDPLGGDISNPQSLNRYAYALNNPATLTDPLGLTAIQYACGVDFCPGAVSFGGGGGNALDYLITGEGFYGGENGDAPDWYPGNFNPDAGYLQNFGSGGSGGGGGGGGGAPPPKPPAKTLPQSQVCSVGSTSTSFGQYLSGVGSAATMFGEFASGLGLDNLTFGPGSVRSQMMSSSPGVTTAANQYLSGGGPTGLYTFGLSGLWNAGFNPIQQYVGSYRWSVAPTNGGLMVALSNSTSVWSGSYHLLGSHSRSSFGPFGNTQQTYQVFVPCHP